MAKVKRSQKAMFMNITPDETNPTYARMGEGITTLTMNYNPSVTTEQYIDDDVATSSIDSYAPTIPVDQACVAGDGVFEFIDDLRKTLPVLSAADTDVIEVDMYETPDTGGTIYPARKWNVSIQFDTDGGDAGPAARITYTLLVRGAPIEGDFDVSPDTAGLVFTADT